MSVRKAENYSDVSSKSIYSVRNLLHINLSAVSCTFNHLTYIV